MLRIAGSRKRKARQQAVAPSASSSRAKAAVLSVRSWRPHPWRVMPSTIRSRSKSVGRGVSNPASRSRAANAAASRLRAALAFLEPLPRLR